METKISANQRPIDQDYKKILEAIRENKFIGEVIKVNPSDFEIYQHANEFYSVKTITGWGEIFAGDSANEDDYDRGLIECILSNWDGTLHWEGERYGYRIPLS